VEQALRGRPTGPYACRRRSRGHATRDRRGDRLDEIVGLYDVLRRIEPSPSSSSTGAWRWRCATARRGVSLIEAILARGDLTDYRPAHAARAELYRRLGSIDDARDAYRRAIALTKQAPERRYLERRLAEL
jgi:RNA polymerase sigma-70 factor (ECF subfamily)